MIIESNDEGWSQTNNRFVLRVRSTSWLLHSWYDVQLSERFVLISCLPDYHMIQRLPSDSSIESTKRMSSSAAAAAASSPRQQQQAVPGPNDIEALLGAKRYSDMLGVAQRRELEVSQQSNSS